MAKKSEIPLRKERLNLYEGDFAKMQRLFPQLGAGPAIRELVHNFIRRMEASKPRETIELPINDLQDLIND